MTVRPIIGRKTIDGTWHADSQCETVTVGDDVFYVAASAVDELVDKPGRWEGVSTDYLALGLVLEHLDMDGMADHFLSDESGYAAMFDRYILTRDSQGFFDVDTYSDVDAAMRAMNAMEDDGLGADEEDAYISYGPGGISACLGNDRLGTFQTLRRAQAAMSVAMRKSGYYPNVWLTGEHGPTIRRIDVW